MGYLPYLAPERELPKDLLDHLGQALVAVSPGLVTADPLRQLLAGHGIRGLVEQMLTDDWHISQMAKSSCRHPNGFDRLVLLDGGLGGPTVRLHIWWPNTGGSTEHIHNHSWAFGSLVLSGALRFQTFRYSQRGEERLAYRSSRPPRHGEHGYRFESLGIRKVQLAFDALMPAGTRYALEHQTLHRVVHQASDLTSTLIIHGPFLRPSSEILADRPLLEGKDVVIPTFTVGELRNKLATYLELLPG